MTAFRLPALKFPRTLSKMVKEARLLKEVPDASLLPMLEYRFQWWEDMDGSIWSVVLLADDVALTFAVELDKRARTMHGFQEMLRCARDSMDRELAAFINSLPKAGVE